MPSFADSFNNALHQVIQGVPKVIYALLLLLLAWVVAIAVRAIISKGFTKIGLDNALSKLPVVKSEDQGKEILHTIGNVVYYLIFILFIPPILDVLGMNTISQPISNMVDKVVGFIPNLFAATVILLIGVFIARLIKHLLFKFLQSLRIDQWFNRLAVETDETEKPNEISSILANIGYIIILIPIIIMALEALNIHSVSDPISSVLNSILNMIPNIFVAIILVTAGYYIAKFVGGLLFKTLQSSGINNVYGFLGIADSKKPSIDLAKTITGIAKFLIMLFFTIEALNVLQLSVLNHIGNAVLVYLPFLVSALIILGLGFFVANLLDHWIRKYANSPFSASIVKYVVIVFAVFMTLNQLQFATTIVNIGFLLILGGLMIAFALSFGIGGREFAKEQLHQLDKKIKNKNEDHNDGTS